MEYNKPKSLGAKMIGKFIWHTNDGDYTVELHWVEGEPLWVVDNEALKYALNLIHAYSGTNHPDSPGYPYWWQALKGKKVTVLVEPPREVAPPAWGHLLAFQQAP